MFKAALLVIIFSATAMASSDLYKLTVERGGVKHEQVAYSDWSGEWPRPIIDVSTNKPGITKIKGFRSLRTLDQPVECNILNGIYHPWGATKNSVISYYTIVGQSDYKVVKEHEVGEGFDRQTLKVGDIVQNVIYGSEGSCWAQIARAGSPLKDYEFFCDEMDKKEYFEKIKSTEGLNEQWLYLRCTNGLKVFIRDEELLKMPGVTHGTFSSYGHAVPADEAGEKKPE